MAVYDDDPMMRSSSNSLAGALRAAAASGVVGKKMKDGPRHSGEQDKKINWNTHQNP